MNATFSALCIQTSLNTEKHKGTQCGETITGNRYTYDDIDFVCINITDASDVLFDGTGSLFRTHLAVEDTHQNLWGVGVDTLFVKNLPVVYQIFIV